jgi:hypothetical protein
VSWQETQRLDKEVRLRAKEAGCCDALDGFPPDWRLDTLLPREEWSGYRLMLVEQGYAEGYAEGSKPLPF